MSKSTIKISEIDLNGIAKFFDAEGSIGVHQPYGHPRPTLLFYNNNKPILESMRGMLNNYGDIYPPHTGAEDECFQYCIDEAPHVREVGELILPYTSIKRAQLFIAIEMCKLIKCRGYNKKDDRDMLKRIRLGEMIKKLNQKGGRANA